MLGLYTHATGCFVRDTAQPFSPFAGAAFWDHCLGYEGHQTSVRCHGDSVQEAQFQVQGWPVAFPPPASA
ncbi:hypothetical protein DTO195F2_5352 [Paecilomyces variotii]|nr:hypothetical protein DTO195F2_5352 [Paecilomyces variotii]